MHKKIFCGLFIMLLVFLCSLSFGSVIAVKMQEDTWMSGDAAPSWGKAQHLEMYPFAESYEEYTVRVSQNAGDEAQTPEGKNAAEVLPTAEKKSCWMDRFRWIEEYTTTDAILFRSHFFEWGKELDRMTGLSVSASLYAGTDYLQDQKDSIVRMENGQLGSALVPRAVDQSMKYIAAFRDALLDQDADFLLFLTPGKYGSDGGHPDHSENLKKDFQAAAEAYHISYVDTEEFLKKPGVTDGDLFYNTDHHWKPSTGIRGVQILAEYLNQNLNYQIDTGLYELDQYDAKLWPDVMLGSYGKKASTAYVDPEDFILYFPKYDTDLQVNRNGISVHGSIAETLLDDSKVSKSSLQDRYGTNLYAAYGYGDQPVIKIHNNLLQDGSNVMMIKTSFADCMFPYLAAGVEDLTVVDLRYFGGSLQALIQEVKPQTVVYVTGLKSFPKTHAEGDAFDFR